MSQTNSPNITLSRTESLDLIIASIALEELALAYILNAEAEKIQYVLGTLPGLSPTAIISNVLAVNESVNCVLQSATQKQMYLQNKLKSVLQAPSLSGPTGAVQLEFVHVALMVGYLDIENLIQFQYNKIKIYLLVKLLQ
ncbi:hypothetical protein [Bacillus cereus]|uniref:hypothetical protein n=1 Tax=Bacillus cereus TaxID=1396 RepID=UPI0003000315|nr:hypothetical protein [Bacillus cereus]MCU5431186.1 hypothetical protein [Bacillus cereus]